MIENSKKWAAARGLVEKSEIHGEDEWRVPIMREFEHKATDRQTRTESVSFETEDTEDTHTNTHYDVHLAVEFGECINNDS